MNDEKHITLPLTPNPSSSSKAADEEIARRYGARAATVGDKGTPEYFARLILAAITKSKAVKPLVRITKATGVFAEVLEAKAADLGKPEAVTEFQNVLGQIMEGGPEGWKPEWWDAMAKFVQWKPEASADSVEVSGQIEFIPDTLHYESFDGHHVCKPHPNGGSTVLFTCETHADAVHAIEFYENTVQAILSSHPNVAGADQVTQRGKLASEILGLSEEEGQVFVDEADKTMARCFPPATHPSLLSDSVETKEDL